MTLLYALGASLGLGGSAVPVYLLAVRRSTVRELDWLAVLPYAALLVVSGAALVERG